MTKAKICGLKSIEDIAVVNGARPDYAGFTFTGQKGQITPREAGRLRKLLHPDIVSVGVFADAPLVQIEALVRAEIIQVIQLHGREDEAYIRTLKEKTGRPIIKAVTVRCLGDAQKWQSAPVDYLLLDSVADSTGKRFDWDLIGPLEKPYFLAGGLNAGNVTEAIARLTPFAVDTSSGVETGGTKDPEKIRAFIRRTRHEYKH